MATVHMEQTELETFRKHPRRILTPSSLVRTKERQWNHAGDTAWVLVSAALVLFMTPGLAFFYGGMVRGKNVLGMLMQNFFAMGTHRRPVGGGRVLASPSATRNGLHRQLRLRVPEGRQRHRRRAPRSSCPARVPDHPAVLFFAFQMMFAIITPALITGATADRLKFDVVRHLHRRVVGARVLPVAHWVFSPAAGSFKRGALDFAGGTAIHINAGIAALAVIVAVIGKRKGYPRATRCRRTTCPSRMLGTGILWFGWFGFNAGSAAGRQRHGRPGLHQHDPRRRPPPCSAGSWWRGSRTATPPPSARPPAPWPAWWPSRRAPASSAGMAPIYIGLTAGVVCYLAVGLKTTLELDDSLDVDRRAPRRRPRRLAAARLLRRPGDQPARRQRRRVLTAAAPSCSWTRSSPSASPSSTRSSSRFVIAKVIDVDDRPAGRRGGRGHRPRPRASHAETAYSN